VKDDKKLYLILGSHAHVPTGASESEFEYVYENKMRPFVSNLYRFPNIHAILHYSGVLLYWVERMHPEFFMLIEDMAVRKQAEILGGGYYEPMFPIIPLHDRIGQIELLTTYLRKHFGKRPQGCWMPGMVWEQHLVSALCASDMSYTFLSQVQFTQAGLSGGELFMPCLSEDQGKLVVIFPVSLTASAALAEKGPAKVFTVIKNNMDMPEMENCLSSDRIITVFPEKTVSGANESPDTAWIRFFEELSQSKNIIETVLPGKLLKTMKVNKRASFPDSSSVYFNNSYKYDFSPRRFLIETSEAGSIYFKMIFTNVLINQLRGDKYRKQDAHEELWKAQDSCLFIPGDVQRRHELRKSAYSSLLRAESLTREKGKQVLSLIQHDFDLDGEKEHLFQDAKINCYIQLNGASIFELDYLPEDWNYLDCGVSNRGASYRGVSANSSGGKVKRTAFSDALVPYRKDAVAFENGFPGGSRLLFNEKFETVSETRKGKACFKLPASGTNNLSCIEISKCYLLKKDVLNVSYTLKNTGREHKHFLLVTEIALSFAGNGDEYVRFYATDSNGKDIHSERRLHNAETLKIIDVSNEVQLILSSVKPYSGSLIKALDNGHYQADRIIAVFPVSIETSEIWINEFTMKISMYSGNRRVD